jgi:hypothetical protein
MTLVLPHRTGHSALPSDRRARRRHGIARVQMITLGAVAALTMSVLTGAVAQATGHTWQPSTWQGVVAGPPMPGENLPPAASPAAPVELPPAYDVQSDYEGQAQCDPAAKPGAQRLSDLIKMTYGMNQTVWIPRACSIGGQSEHKEGRALDWMTSIRDPQGRANAEQFLRWLLGPDQYGQEYGHAKRLGIMYVAWNDRVWRAYDMKRGWTEMKGCFSRTSRGNDTVCHRDHIHISLSWDGATGTNSFWDGTPQEAGFCPRATTSARTTQQPAGAVVGIEPVRVLETSTGLGVPQRCRLQQDRWSGDSHRIFVPVLGQGGVPATGVSGVRVRVTAVNSNAPSTIRVWSPGQSSSQPVVKVGINGTQSGVANVPVSTEGTIALATTAGATDVTVDVLGWYRAGAEGAPSGGTEGGNPEPAPAPSLEPVPEFVPLGSVVSYESVSQGGPLKPGEERTVDLAGLPENASSALIFLTARDATGKGELRIGRVDKTASASMSFRKKMKKSVMIVPVSGGKVVLSAAESSAVNVRVEVLGYATGAGAPRATVLSPRVMFTTKLVPGKVKTFKAAKASGLPGKKKLSAVLLRVVTTKATADGTVSIYGNGGTPPGTRSAPVVANTLYAAIIAAPIGADGKVAVSSTVPTKAQATIVGYIGR